ncbi:hypothetical protein WEI85_20620 [Actinomycetes bacterium KLBMP 9797]
MRRRVSTTRGATRATGAPPFGHTPAAPAVRAAAFRPLADTPGVRAEGQVQDARGRTGPRIAYETQGELGEIVIDEAAVQILSHSRSYPDPQRSRPSGCR